MKNLKPKYKYSRQKEMVLKVLMGTTSHPTADWIYNKLKKKIHKLSMGTVYRNLNILKAQGLIQELGFGSTFDRFDGNASPHYHFICKNCKKVYDVNLLPEMQLNPKAEKTTHFKVDSHRLDFFGLCVNCQ
jgi:Fe2+ or Zn2+ uptake regulation protein